MAGRDEDVELLKQAADLLGESWKTVADLEMEAEMRWAMEYFRGSYISRWPDQVRASIALASAREFLRRNAA